MRIISLMPAATEILFALGLGDDIVGVTHACDEPTEALAVRRVTFEAHGEPSRTRPPLTVDVDRCNDLEPDLIVTDANVGVHELSGDEVRELAEEMDTQPMVLALDPRTLGEVLGDVRTLAQTTDTKDEGVDIIREASDRIDRIRVKVRRTQRPRVVALESLDPPRPAGHWLPQLIEYAGGEDVLGFAGEESEPLDWPTIALASPDIVLVMPSGYDAELAYREAEMHREQLQTLGARAILALDSARYFATPGLRLIDGLEIIATALHPDLVEANPEHAEAALTVEL